MPDSFLTGIQFFEKFNNFQTFLNFIKNDMLNKAWASERRLKIIQNHTIRLPRVVDVW